MHNFYLFLLHSKQVSVHKEGDHQVIQVTTRIPIKPEPKNRTRVITKTTLPVHTFKFKIVLLESLD